MQEYYSSLSGACRLCLNESEFQLFIFGDTGQRLDIHFKIQSCFPTLQVTQHDGLPDSICYRCLFSLEQTYDFWTKCHTTEAILSKHHFQRKHQVINEQKRINYQSREASFPYTADDTDWDEWFIWDATYKRKQTPNNYSQQMPITHLSKSQVNSPNLMCQSVGIEDTNQVQAKKKGNSLFKYDFLQEDANENKDLMKIADSHNVARWLGEPAPQRSILKTNATNFSSNFWKQNPLNSKMQKYVHPLASSLHPPLGEFKKEVQKVSNSHNSEQTSPNYFSQDKTSINKLLNQYGCHMFSTNNEIKNSKENSALTYNASICDDVLTNATNLLQRFRSKNSLYY